MNIRSILKNAFPAVALMLWLGQAALAQTNDEYKKADFFAGVTFARNDFGVQKNNPRLSTSPLTSQLTKKEDFKGFTAAGTYNIAKKLGLRADYSVNNNRRNLFNNSTGIELKERLSTFLAGVEIKNNAKEGGLRPFAYAMMGLARARTRTDQAKCAAAFGAATGCPSSLNTSTNGLALSLGGGLDFKFSPGIAVRLVQWDYTPVRLNGTFQKGYRISTGIVF